jgi:hypothetical protein
MKYQKPAGEFVLLRESAARLAVVFVLPFLLTAQVQISDAKVGQEALTACEDHAFSVEVEFVTWGPEPPDGNPIISGGDLLSFDPRKICARNGDLLNALDVDVDLGLDAVDVIDVDNYLVVFSTEIDSSTVGQFTAGDLLVTNGAIISNGALLSSWQVSRDLGLDAVHMVGNIEEIVAFLTDAATYPSVGVEELLQLFGSYSSVDIWFSTEGTFGAVSNPVFLDGDLLSARNGVILAKGSELLPASVPAGIPQRGVDLGLDAVSTDRAGQVDGANYSTELLFDSLGDGDVLNTGGNIVVFNATLLAGFEPKSERLGVDALFGTIPTIFVDDFESGDVTRWSDSAGYSP